MGKTGRWLRNFLTGKKDTKEKESKNSANNDGYDLRPATPVSAAPPTTPKEKRRWSFRRSSAAATGRPELSPADISAVSDHGEESGSRKHALAVAVATAAAADAAVAAAKAVIQLAADDAERERDRAVEEAAAVKIQAVFRSYLARKALNALKGLVKLQALVRGHLVRKQAKATLRCMQALVSVQARALAQRMRMAEQIKQIDDQTPYTINHPRKSTQDHRFITTNSNQIKAGHFARAQDFDRGAEENIKIVEMDLGGGYRPASKPRNSYSQPDPTNHRISGRQVSPSPSAITDASPRTCSNHFEDFSFGGTTQSSPQCYIGPPRPDPARLPPFPSYPRSEYAESMCREYPLYPGYMANTESSRAKARSHSAPKQRPVAEEALERHLSGRRRPSVEGRNLPRAVRMQRSSSHVGSVAQNYQYPWCMKLDQSAVSLKDSECGSTSTVLTNTNYCRSHVGFEVQGARYL